MEHILRRQIHTLQNLSRQQEEALNKYEGNQPRVLFVCSAGLLRSPTAAFVAQQKFGWNTRAAGAMDEYALIPVNGTLIMWADKIFCMSWEHAEIIKAKYKGLHPEQKIVVLSIPDEFPRMDSKLVQILEDALAPHAEEMVTV